MSKSFPPKMYHDLDIISGEKELKVQAENKGNMLDQPTAPAMPRNLTEMQCPKSHLLNKDSII